jgi:hypothetical protein
VIIIAGAFDHPLELGSIVIHRFRRRIRVLDQRPATMPAVSAPRSL